MALHIPRANNGVADARSNDSGNSLLVPTRPSTSSHLPLWPSERWSHEVYQLDNIVEHQLNEYLWEKCFIQHSFTIYSPIYGSDILLLSLWYYEQFIMYAKIDSHMRNAVFELPRETRNDLVS